MVRIYFDKQIFSYLFKPKEEKFILLLEKIYANKHNFLFYYSDAHLQDLTKADREVTLRELDFMKGIVNDNYITYDSQRKSPICLIGYPNDAFSEYKDIENMEFYGDIDLSSLNEEQRSLLENVADIFMQSEKRTLDNTWFLTREPIKGETKYDDVTLVNVIRSTMQVLISNANTYKMLRRVASEEYNKGRLESKDGDMSFNDTMKETSIGVSYLELIVSCLKQVGLTSYSDYDFYNMAYSMLDMLGISKEKEKSVKFGNMLTDGKHSYYASLCDCFICHDKGCVNKTQILYKLLGFKTKVYHIDDFIEAFDKNIIISNRCLDHSFQAILEDYVEGELLKVEEKNNIKVTDIKTKLEYFGFFDYMRECIIDGDKFIILSKEPNRAQNFIAYNEIKLITDKLIGLIGDDCNGLGVFENDEIKKIDNVNNWDGRQWNFIDSIVHLNMLDYPYGISLIISVKKTNAN